MTPRTIGILGIAAVLVIGLVDLLIGSRLTEQATFWYYSITRIGLLALVAAAAAAAAQQFSWWSDYFGRAWSLFFIAYAFIAATHVSRRFLDHAGEHPFRIIGNLAMIGGYWLMARSLRAAGLRYHGSSVTRIVFMLIVVVVAVGLVYDSILTELEAFRAGKPALSHLVSAVADLITFVLVAPLLLTTFAFRGGELYWTFGFLTIGTFGWVLNQAARRILELVGRVDLVASGRMVGFALACLFTAAAAFTHFLAVYRTRHREDIR